VFCHSYYNRVQLVSETSAITPCAESVRDAKILDRLLEWARTADEKAARLALIAVGLSLFWLYYGFIVPRAAKHRVKSLEADLTVIDGLIERFDDLRARYRELAFPKRSRATPTTYPVPFFVDVGLPGVQADRAVPSDERQLAGDLVTRLANVARLVEAYHTFVAQHPEAAPAKEGAAAQQLNSGVDALDPTGVLTNLVEIETLMIDLHRINTTGANTEWVDSIQRALAAKSDSVALPNTFTSTLLVYEPLVGTWVRDANAKSADVYTSIAAANGEQVPKTLAELNALRDHLAESLTEARHELRVTRLRLPFTSIDVDRATVLVGVPILILLLFHYAASYLLLANALGTKTAALWGAEAEVLALDYRPSDAIFHRFFEAENLPRYARNLRHSLWLVVRVVLPTVPLIVLLIAAFEERSGTESALQRYSWIAVYILLMAYALVTAQAFWRVIKRRSS